MLRGHSFGIRSSKPDGHLMMGRGERVIRRTYSSIDSVEEERPLVLSSILFMFV